jgi:hypothetical protein
MAENKSINAMKELKIEKLVVSTSTLAMLG